MVLQRIGKEALILLVLLGCRYGAFGLLLNAPAGRQDCLRSNNFHRAGYSKDGLPFLPWRRIGEGAASSRLCMTSDNDQESLLLEQQSEPSNTIDESTFPSLHSIVIQAIAEALLIRAKQDPEMPLRLQDGMEEWEIMLTAGTIAQSTLTSISKNRPTETELTTEEQNAIGGRIVATLIRLDYLEEELQGKCAQWMEEGRLKNAAPTDQSWRHKFGLPSELPKGKRQDGQFKDSMLQIDSTMAMIRAECLYAIFLDSIEGPGLKFSGESIPGGSQVDFLDDERRRVLLTSTESQSEEPEDIRPSLHTVAIQGIVNALQLRAKRKKFSPLRPGEGVDEMQMLVTAGRVAEDAVNMHKQKLRPKEQELIGGRIVSVTLRLEELEAELHRRCSTVQWIAQPSDWEAFGLLQEEGNIDEIDSKISNDEDFASVRAKGLLAIFLEDYEKPMFNQGGVVAPDESEVDFLDQSKRQVIIPSNKR